MAKKLPKTFVLKIASRCNIACKYCYMYFRGDDSVLRKPKKISRSVLNDFISNLNAYCEKNDIKKIVVSLHGGEPLLVGKDSFSMIASTFRKKAKPEVSLRLQTNGILIDSEWINLFEKFQIMVGVSLDGNESANDENRVYFNGKGTYSKVVNGIKVLQEANLNRQVKFGGVISVINLSQDPVIFYHHFTKELGLNVFNVLLPDSNHDNYWKYNSLPPMAYGGYLCSLFDVWVNDAGEVNIPFFSSIVSLICGGLSSSETVGSMGSTAVSINTDGDFEVHDVLRMNDGYHENQRDFNVSCTNIEDITKTEIFELSRMDEFPPDLKVKCNKCPVFHICKGGFFGHRFSKEKGYMNHNVFCDALFKIITHIYFYLVESGSTNFNVIKNYGNENCGLDHL
jgi:uncharacterized protein